MKLQGLRVLQESELEFRSVRLRLYYLHAPADRFTVAEAAVVGDRFERMPELEKRTASSQHHSLSTQPAAFTRKSIDVIFNYLNQLLL